MQLDLEELISAHSDSPVSQSAKQDYKKQSQMTGGSGMKLLEYYKLANRNGSLLKMLEVLLASKTAYSSRSVSLIWKLKDMKFNRLLFQLVPKTHHIDETEFGSSDKMWMTPTTVQIEPNEERREKRIAYRKSIGRQDSPGSLTEQVMTPSLWPTPNAWDAQRGPRSQKNLIEKDHQITLITAVKDAQSPTPTKMWPTPTTRDWKDTMNTVPPSIGKTRGHSLGQKVAAEMKLWPTPNASEARQGYQDRTKGKLGTQKSLSTEIIDSEGGRQATVGQLNSQWVTWLMGYPEGYLDISTESRHTSQELPKEKKTEPKS